MKKIMQRVVSFICAGLVAFGTIVSSCPVAFCAASVGAGIAAVIGVIGSIKEFCENVQWVWEIAKPIVDDVNAAGNAYMTPIREYYKSYWNEIIVRGELTEAKFREYWEFVVLNGEDSTKEVEYPGISDTYVMLIETVASGVSLDELCSLFFNSDGSPKKVYSVNEKDQTEVPASIIKDYYKDYASRYMPMPNVEQYTVSWQNSNSEKYGTENKYFREAAPVYTNTRAWGNKGWTECYAMSFFVDPEQPGSPYFSNEYVHFYSTKDENNNVIIHYDVYNLDDNQLKWEKSEVWDISKYPVLGYRLGGNDYWLYEYSSYQNCFVNNGSGVYSVVSGTLTSSVNRSTQTLDALISYTWSTYHPTTQKTDDYGYILSSKPFELFLNQTSKQKDRIPDNYVITINGDTIYDYSVTNPDTGQTSTVNNYVNNNYTLPEKEPSGGDGSGGSSGGSGTVSGNVTVGGKVDVSGKIDISTNPIDINVNVNNSGSGSSGGSGSGDSSGVEFDQDLSLNNYYDWMQQQSTGFSGFMKQFLSWLPEDIVIMLCAGLALVILARFIGR